MLHFEKLIVWQKSIELARKLVEFADELPQKYQFSFADQLRRAALSIPSNIAEGAGRTSHRDRSNFYSIAKGSVYETVNILKLLQGTKTLEATSFNFEDAYNTAEEISKMIYGLSR